MGLGSDVVLEFEARSELAFIAGLASFLLAHVCYIVFFFARARRWPVTPLLFVAVGAAFLLSTLLPHVARRQADLLAPVCVYCAAIAVMAYAAISSGSALATAGALVFVVSDFALAYDKFAPAPLAWWWQPRLIVMVTYYVAQLLITASFRSVGPLKSKSK